ncbi:ABC-2 family transporter protein [Nostoc sp.]|uniref:ABC-2 family transporter protein n=1 Tax=Nostoc sp. TaxID=1180 RepID=UPI003FA559DF
MRNTGYSCVHGLLEARCYAIAAYTATYRFFFIFIFVMPVAFLTPVPVQVMLGLNEVC